MPARIIDTSAWAESHGNFWDDDAWEAIRDAYEVALWSIVVLEEVAARQVRFQPGGDPPRKPPRLMTEMAARLARPFPVGGAGQ